MIFKIMTAFREHSLPLAIWFPPTDLQKIIGRGMFMGPDYLKAVTMFT